MPIPERSLLPLPVKQHSITIDEKKVEEFHRAFKDKRTYTPPTLMAVSMKGVFEFLNEFEIDWRKLLHATQSFTYHSPIKIPLEAISETKLADVKFRNSIHWLSFETQVKDKATSKPLITSKSLLLVRES